MTNDAKYEKTMYCPFSSQDAGKCTKDKCPLWISGPNICSFNAIALDLNKLVFILDNMAGMTAGFLTQQAQKGQKVFVPDSIMKEVRKG